MKLTRIAAGLLAASMMTAVSATVAFAADTVTFTAEKVNAEQGSNFTLNVDVSGVPTGGISAAEFSVTYDASVITITDVAAGSIVNTASDGFSEVAVFDAVFDEAGKITVTYGTVGDASTWVNKDGTFLTITGVASGEEGASTAVKVEPVNRPYHEGSTDVISEIYVGSVDSAGTVTEYAVQTTAGSVTIGEGGGNQTAGLPGDVDLNGVVDIIDVVAANKYILGKQDLSAEAFANADLNGDGTLAAIDTLNILKMVVGLPVTLA